MHCILLNIKMIMEGARIHIYSVIPGIYPPAPAAPPPAKKSQRFNYLSSLFEQKEAC